MNIEWVELPGKRKPRLRAWHKNATVGTLVRVRFRKEEKVILFGDVGEDGNDSGDFGYYDNWLVIAYSMSLCDIVKKAKGELPHGD